MNLRSHRGVLVVVAVLAAVFLGTAAVAIVLWLRNFDNLADQLSAEAVDLTAGTFALALVAGVLAAIAYAQSVRRPRLAVSISLVFRGLGAGSNPVDRTPQRVVEVSPLPQPLHSVWSDAGALPPGWLRISLSNTGEAAARNVTVTFDVVGMQVGPGLGLQLLDPSWSVIDFNYANGWLRLQWEGGALAVHTDAIVDRVLPEVRFGNVYARPGTQIRAIAIASGDGCAPAIDRCDLDVVAQTVPGV